MSGGCGPVGVLVLAGGRGRRAHPCDKLLVRDPAGRTLIGRTVAGALASRADRVLLVLGDRPARIRAACPGIDHVQARDHAEGLAGSLRAGIGRAMRDGWAAAILSLGDMPLVRTTTLDRLIAAWRDADPRPDAVVPACGGRPGNPVLWDSGRFALLLGLRGDTGARHLLRRTDLAVRTLETGDDGIGRDFDTPARLAAFAAARCDPAGD